MASAATPAERTQHHTYCRLCEALCGMVATVEHGRVVSIAPNPAHRHSHGHVCVKGVSAHAITNDPERLAYPLKRVGGPGEFTRVGWDEALGDIARRLSTLIDAHGADAFGLYLGNPTSFSSLNLLYSMGFPAALGSAKVFSASSQDAASRIAANELLYGAAGPFVIPDLPATEMLLVFGANPAVSKGSLICAPRMADDLKDIERRGGRVVIFDPRRTETASKHEHVFVKPEMDAWAIIGILNILERDGHFDRAFIAAHTSGFERVRGFLGRVTPEAAAERSGVALAVLEEVARAFGSAGRAAVYSRVGVCRGRFSTLTNALIDMLAILTGRFSTAGGIGFGLDVVNGDGGSAVAKGGDAAGGPRTRIGGFPAPGGHMPSGVLAADITEPGDDRIRALMTVGGNPVLSSPDGAGLENALSQLELMVSLDLYMTETSRFADYILPTTSFLERDDIAMSNVSFMIRPHLMGTRRVVQPTGDVREEHEIFWELCDRMGIDSPLPMIPMVPPSHLTPKERHVEILSAMVSMSAAGDQGGSRPDGLSLAALLDEHPHGLALAGEDFIEKSLAKLAHADGRIHLCDDPLAAEFERLLASAEEDTPRFKLIGRRDLRSMNSWMHNAERLVRSQRPTLLMHPRDAEAEGLVEGQQVVVTSKKAAVTVPLEISDEIMPGVVSYPHGFGHARGGWSRANATSGVNINLLASGDPEDLERISGSTLLDGIPVSISAA